MMRLTLNGAGDRVRVPVGEDYLNPLLDALAIAYAEDPDTVGTLLAAHAPRVLRLDYAVFAEDMPEHVREMRAAEAQGSREALLAEVQADVQTDPLLTADEAITYATRLTKTAGFIRHTSTKRNPA